MRSVSLQCYISPSLMAYQVGQNAPKKKSFAIRKAKKHKRPLPLPYKLSFVLGAFALAKNPRLPRRNCETG